MPTRAPVKDDFSADIAPLVDIIVQDLGNTPNQKMSTTPQNVLLLMHGLGDTSAPFVNLGRALNLPETVSIALRAPFALPFGLPGFHWGDDISFTSDGEIDHDAHFTSAAVTLNKIIVETLIEKLAFTPNSIFMLGFGQGGMVALDYASRWNERTQEFKNMLGGVISIGGPLPNSSPAETNGIPVLIIGSETGSYITVEAEKRIKNVFHNVRVVRWKGRSRDGPITNKSEAQDILQFLATRLRSHAGVPKDQKFTELH